MKPPPAKVDTDDRWWLSISETAEQLQVSRRSVGRMIEAGTLPSTRLGRRRVVHRDLVAAIVAGKVRL